MKVKIIQGLSEAKKIWDVLSSKKTVYDDWIFRFTYYKYFNYPIFFYTAFYDNKPVGLLPLQHNTDNGYLEFFGGSYMEDNQIFVLDDNKEIQSLLVKSITQPTLLEWMQSPISGFNSTISDYKYELPLDGIESVDEYLLKYWKSKPRNNLRSQVRKIEEQGLIVEEDIQEDFDSMIEGNKKRFGNESTFYFPHRVDFLRDLIKLYNVHFISISVGGKKEAVGMSLFYKGRYIGTNSGTNPHINGLGKLLALEKIKQALKLGAIQYDARATESGWKEAFGFTPRPQYQLDLR